MPTDANAAIGLLGEMRISIDVRNNYISIVGFSSNPFRIKEEISFTRTDDLRHDFCRALCIAYLKSKEQQ